jgi:hypoxanthine phosphoribosyltransferase
MDVRLAQSIYDLSPNDFRNLVVIDDICDSGHTFQVMKQLAPTAKTVTMFHRSTATFNPDYYDEYVTTENWLQFPWEANNANS